MARVYADVNQHMPKSYWEYDSVNITWGVLENYEVVRKIGMITHLVGKDRAAADNRSKGEESTRRSSKA